MTIPFVHERSVFVRVHLDANRINSRQRLPAVNQLETWQDDDVIELFMSETAHDEARDGGDPARTRKALGYIYSISMANTAGEQARIREIEGILGGSEPLDANTKRDAEIVFNAAKYSAILATADKRILRNRQELHRLGARVMSDEEVVTHIREKVAERDQFVRISAEHDGRPMPDWVGRD
jgi:hypothetical protein